MFGAIKVKPNGEITSAFTGDVPSQIPDGYVALSSIPSIGFDITRHYYDHIDGSLVEMPDQPSPTFRFDYDLKQWVDTRTTESQWALVREERGRLLQESDWTQLADVAIPSKLDWATYRQALRDVTLQPDPFDIAWPTPPA